MSRAIRPGRPFPLGATWDGEGVNFALFSSAATSVEVCLFDADDPSRETERIRLREITALIHHGYVPGLGPGQLYGFRVDGPYEPERGLRCNPAKLLIDPYAKALTGALDWEAPVFGYAPGNPEGDLQEDGGDDAAGIPKGVVIDPGFDWRGDAPPRIPWHETIIYEAHVRGLTIRHPEVPEALRGTYAGVASKPIIEHFRDLGITAVELMPIHAFIDQKRLLDQGLRNYWGYDTVNFFAPEARYSGSGDRGEQVREFKEMVRALHAAGIEVILDVVYNHTAEGNHLGPTLSFKGIDNPSYYRLVADDPRYYVDYTGTGNSLNASSPEVLRLIMDSLRYWVLEMHVDGFRFDLAATLARELRDVDRLGSFFDIIHQDPVLSQVKLIAEPWDVGPGGYQVGNFPVLWTEWNGRYRDTVRAYWRGDPGAMAELGYRLTGSSDLYGDDGRRPYASINFVTAHDGFTLADLVSYDRKHNEMNGEENRDGNDHALSWNCGAEGPTDDPGVLELRERQKRNFLATLLFSQGVPMISGGDELGRTQEGNNNAYCQDNEISWYDWELDDRRRALLDFTKRVVALRREHPALHRRRFFRGRKIHGSEIRDITWFQPSGEEMAEEEWQAQWARALAMRMGGEALGEVDENGDLVRDDSLLILFNAHHEAIDFHAPAAPGDQGWELVLDTASVEPAAPAEPLGDGATYPLGARALALFRAVSPEAGQ
ncbi:MAG TPA: glycogen debranching protein GlgX [Longimicrobiaceae bacterium]|nr:glycogen debranching protein GlgX [Longimicrobiaceae bacterium]